MLEAVLTPSHDVETFVVLQATIGPQRPDTSDYTNKTYRRGLQPLEDVCLAMLARRRRRRNTGGVRGRLAGSGRLSRVGQSHRNGRTARAAHAVRVE